MANFDLSGLALKMICPTNELITDDKGLPGVYVRRASKTLKELLNTTNDTVHPAFMISNDQKPSLLFGKFQGVAHNNRIYSLPGEDPKASITLDTYVSYCKNKGPGHHCITAAEWAFLALLAKKNGTQPYGNNNYGKDSREAGYIAIPTTKDSSTGQINRVATGTGPLTWSDDRTLSGIWDLNGNVWEWVAGIRLVYGELQVIPYNNAADPNVPIGASSTEWKAINANATSYSDLYIEPDGSGTTANSVKLDYETNHWAWVTTITSQDDSSRSAAFVNTIIGTAISDFAALYLRAMALAPEEGDTDYESDYFWANNGAAERCASRGGRWYYGSDAGVFHVNFDNSRSGVGASIGGRPAYYE